MPLENEFPEVGKLVDKKSHELTEEFKKHYLECVDKNPEYKILEMKFFRVGQYKKLQDFK